MSIKQNRTRVVAELNRRNWAMVDEIVPADYIYHGSTGTEHRGREASTLFMAQFGTAFPDFHMAIDDMLGLQRFKAMYYLLGL